MECRPISRRSFYQMAGRLYLLGDGSPTGLRTTQMKVIPLMRQARYEERTRAEKLWEVPDVLAAILGAERVRISRDGFTVVGRL
jgi:hypothetical protein